MLKHDLLFRYGKAVKHGLESNTKVLSELPLLNKLHMVHYARYPNPETQPVPAYISNYDDVVDKLFADVRKALGVLGQG